MKQILKISLLFCVVIIGGSILAQIHPLVLKEENHFESPSDSGNTEKSFAYVSETHRITENLAVVSAMPDEALNRELEALFWKKDWDTDFLYVSADILLGKLVRDNPQRAMALLNSEMFSGASEKIRGTAIGFIFTHLARYYPNCFEDAIAVFKTGDENSFDNHVIFAFEPFFNEIRKNDPEWLYAYMTDGSMDQLLELICGDLSEESNLSKSFEVYRDMLWRELIASMGVLKRDALLVELSKLSQKGGWHYERYRLLRGLVLGITEDNVLEVSTWAMKHLTKKDKEFFSELYFYTLKKREATSEEFILFLNTIDKELWEDLYIEDAIQSIARKDLVGAIDLINVSLGGYEREMALTEVLCALNRKKSVQEMLPIVNGLSDGMCKSRVAIAFIDKYYAEAPEQAVAWVRENFTYEEQELLLQRVQGEVYQARVIMDEDGNPKSVPRIMEGDFGVDDFEYEEIDE